MSDSITPEQLRAQQARDMLERGRHGLQQQVMDRMEVYGWLAYHTFDARKSSPGYPDVIALRNGRRLAIELKREGEWPTSDQEDWLNAYADVDEGTMGATNTYLLFPSDLIDGTVDDILDGSDIWYALWTTRRDEREEQTT